MKPKLNRPATLAAAHGSAARCRHDERDAANDQLAAALGRWIGEQPFAGTKIKNLKLRPAEETLRWQMPPNGALCDPAHGDAGKPEIL